MFKYFLCFTLATATLHDVFPNHSQADLSHIVQAYKNGESTDVIMSMIAEQTSHQDTQQRWIKKPSNDSAMSFIIGAGVGATIVIMSAASFCTYAHYADKPSKPSQTGNKRSAKDCIVPRKDFFKDVIGMTETEFKAKYEANDPAVKNMLQKKDGVNILVCGENTFNCGTLDQLSIQYLRQQYEEKDKPGGGKLNVIEGQSPRGESTKFVDVGALQSNPEYKDAVFQVASNFNALEQVNAEEDIEAKLVETYITDWTQGPFASISAAPGLIYRRYFMFNDPNKDVSEWGQTKDGNRQVNFLEDICNNQTNVTMSQGGYVRLTDADLKAPTDDLYQNIKIGFHSDTDVTHGKINLSNNTHIKNGSINKINQVFTAAPNLGQFIGDGPNPTQQEWANKIIDAAYEGTIRSAFVNNKKKVVLTLIGGGVFGNKFEHIGASIAKMQPIIEESGLDVTLNWYDSNGDAQEWKQGQAQVHTLKEILKPLVAESGGTWTVVAGNNQPQKIDLPK